MKEFVKVVRLGLKRPAYSKTSFSVYAKITYHDGRLSVSGVEGPLPSGNARGGCGQIVMHLKNEVEQINPAPGWDHDKIKKFLELWERWHLNDLRAGTPDQEEFLRNHKADWEANQKLVKERLDHYDWARKILAENKLDPDPRTGYRYGNGWLWESVPHEILLWFYNLPDADQNPAWV